MQESEAKQTWPWISPSKTWRATPRAKPNWVELRYFAGFSEEESAACLDISVRTVRREWQIAKTRLRMAIDGHPAA